ncbi:MAG TPA: hypothetical protein DCQ64_27970 [Candidatus Rokubacteria bacterium]|nr:hypothetical protein [Candidatus Rokubacteria bacterium]
MRLPASEGLRMLPQHQQRLGLALGQRLDQMSDGGLVAGDLDGLTEEAQHGAAPRGAEPLPDGGAQCRHVQRRIAGVAERAHRGGLHAPALPGQPGRGLVPHEVSLGQAAVDGVGIPGEVLEREGRPAAGPGQERFVDPDAERGDPRHDHIGIERGEHPLRGLEERGRIPAGLHVGGAVGQRKADRLLAGGREEIEGWRARHERRLEPRVVA